MRTDVEPRHPPGHPRVVTNVFIGLRSRPAYASPRADQLVSGLVILYRLTKVNLFKLFSSLPKGKLMTELLRANLSTLKKTASYYVVHVTVAALGRPAYGRARSGGRLALSGAGGYSSGRAPDLLCRFDHQPQLVALRLDGDVVAVHRAAEAALR